MRKNMPQPARNRVSVFVFEKLRFLGRFLFGHKRGRRPNDPSSPTAADSNGGAHDTHPNIRDSRTEERGGSSVQRMVRPTDNVIVNHVTGSEFGNQVLSAYARHEIPLPLVMTTKSENGRMTVTDMQGNPLPTLQAKYEELYGPSGPEYGHDWESKKSAENLSAPLNSQPAQNH